MDSRNRLVIIDGHEIYRQMLLDYLGFYPEYEIVGVFDNGTQAARECLALRPDFLILDYATPFLDGLGLLEAIHKRAPVPRPRIILLLPANHSRIIERGRELGVDCCLVRPFGLNTLLDHLRLLGGGSLTTQLPPSEIVDSFLLACGMEGHLQGFRYCSEAIMLLLDYGPRSASGIGKIVYGALSANHHKSIASIERSIRYAVVNAAGVQDMLRMATQSNVAFLYAAYCQLKGNEAFSRFTSKG